MARRDGWMEIDFLRFIQMGMKMGKKKGKIILLCRPTLTLRIGARHLILHFGSTLIPNSTPGHYAKFWVDARHSDPLHGPYKGVMQPPSGFELCNHLVTTVQPPTKYQERFWQQFWVAKHTLFYYWDVGWRQGCRSRLWRMQPPNGPCVATYRRQQW